MVMVLLFLGTIFLLVGFQALGSSGGDDDTGHPPPSKPAAASSEPAHPKDHVHQPDVQVYNISEQAGLAGRTADHLREAGWNVTIVDNLDLPHVTETTVYFGEAQGEHEAANSVAELLHAAVHPRIPEVAEQPPGIIVLVAG